MPAATPYVGHVDADAFHVGAERVRFPALRGRPVGVLGNQGACVIAKSYELKAAGVKTGMPVWEAKALCPHGVYVKRDFRWYEVLSRRMLDVVRTFSPRVEWYVHVHRPRGRPPPHRRRRRPATTPRRGN